jgi:low affinity Fe/Cu permease
MSLTLLRSIDPAKTSESPDIANMQKRDLFGKVASWTTRFTGGRWGFALAFGTILVWAITGPIFQFSDQWQLVMNTATSIITFLMVFLIQNAQNRESKALHLKLDELILSTRRARNELIDIELLTEEQLNRLGERYRRVSETCHANIDDEAFLNPHGNDPLAQSSSIPVLVSPTNSLTSQ